LGENLKLLLRLISIIVVPPIIGLCLFSVYLHFFSFDQSALVSWSKFKKDMPFLLAASFGFSIIPSLFVFGSFELIFRKFLKSRVSYAVFGVLAGYLSSVSMLFLVNKQIWLIHSLNFIGFVVGWILGYVLYMLRKKDLESCGEL